MQLRRLQEVLREKKVKSSHRKRKTRVGRFTPNRPRAGKQRQTSLLGYYVKDKRHLCLVARVRITGVVELQL